MKAKGLRENARILGVGEFIGNVSQYNVKLRQAQGEWGQNKQINGYLWGVCVGIGAVWCCWLGCNLRRT